MEIPANIPAEESLLASVMLDAGALEGLRDEIRPEDFYRTAHQAIFQAALDLYERGRPVELVTIVSALTESGRLEEIGGAAAVARITDTVPVAPNALTYARYVLAASERRALIELGRKIMQAGQQSAKDPGEVLDRAQRAVMALGDNGRAQGFEQADVSAAIDYLEKIHQSGKKPGLPTGLKAIDASISGLHRSDLIILAARPGMGKTALALNIASNLAKEGVPVGFFSLEMDKMQLVSRALSGESLVNGMKFRNGGFSRDDWDAVIDAAGRLDGFPLHIADAPNVTPDALCRNARRLIRQAGAGLIVVDFLQLVRVQKATNRREEIGEAAVQLKNLAKDTRTPVLVLSQLNRKVEDRADGIPRASDLKESGEIEQAADVILMVGPYLRLRDKSGEQWPDHDPETTRLVWVAKNRHGRTGPVVLKWDGRYTRFFDVQQDDEVPDF